MRLNKLNESIYEFRPEDPMNPEVLVQGYGRMNLKQLEQVVASDLERMTNRANSGDWNNLHHALNNTAFQAKLNAIISTYEELEAIRRKGGKNARGIEKR